MENKNMTRLPETVTSKFTELFAALHYAADDLKIVGQEAILSGDFSQVNDSMEACRKLQALEADIKAAVKNFHTQYPAQALEKTGFHKKDKRRTRKQGGRLRVTVAGKVIQENTLPLIARTPTKDYQTQARCDGWYITTHVNKVTATTVLQEIAKALDTPLKIECIER